MWNQPQYSGDHHSGSGWLLEDPVKMPLLREPGMNRPLLDLERKRGSYTTVSQQPQAASHYSAPIPAYPYLSNMSYSPPKTHALYNAQNENMGSRNPILQLDEGSRSHYYTRPQPPPQPTNRRPYEVYGSRTAPRVLLPTATTFVTPVKRGPPQGTPGGQGSSSKKKMAQVTPGARSGGSADKSGGFFARTVPPRVMAKETPVKGFFSRTITASGSENATASAGAVKAAASSPSKKSAFVKEPAKAPLDVVQKETEKPAVMNGEHRSEKPDLKEAKRLAGVDESTQSEWPVQEQKPQTHSDSALATSQNHKGSMDDPVIILTDVEIPVDSMNLSEGSGSLAIFSDANKTMEQACVWMTEQLATKGSSGSVRLLLVVLGSADIALLVELTGSSLSDEDLSALITAKLATLKLFIAKNKTKVDRFVLVGLPERVDALIDVADKVRQTYNSRLKEFCGAESPAEFVVCGRTASTESEADGVVSATASRFAGLGEFLKKQMEGVMKTQET